MTGKVLNFPILNPNDRFIKDMENSFAELSNIEKGLAGQAKQSAEYNDISHSCIRLRNIIEVYNENVEIINRRATYGKIAKQYVDRQLKERIEEVYNKATSQRDFNMNEILPQLHLELPQVDGQPNVNRNLPQLSLNGLVKVRSSIAQKEREDAAIAHKNREDAAKAEVAKKEAAEAKAESKDKTLGTVNVWVRYKTEENILGICVEPDWQAKPIAFDFRKDTPEDRWENAWKGEIPSGKHFKFVLLKDGKVNKWEQHENRILQPSSYSTIFPKGEIRFA